MRRTWPITALLAFKLLTQTVPSGIIVLLDPAGAVKESGQPAPLTEPFFLHMVFMWAMWQCFFQAPLELFFGTVPSPDLDVDRAREDADPNLIVSLRTFMAVTISS